MKSEKKLLIELPLPEIKRMFAGISNEMRVSGVSNKRPNKKSKLKHLSIHDETIPFDASEFDIN